MRKSTSALWFSFVLAIASGSVFAQNADMSITKVDNSNHQVAAGQDFSYVVVIGNNGPSTATNVVLNDVLPTGPTFVSFSFNGGTAGNCTAPAAGATGGTVPCTYPPILNGGGGRGPCTGKV